MKEVFEAAWESFEQYIKEHNDLMLNDQKNQFIQECCDLYDSFISKYMNPDNLSADDIKKRNSFRLDRHKIGAIIAIIGSNGDYIQKKSPLSKKEFFVGRYTIPLAVGLQLVIDDINRDLSDFKIKKYKLPLEFYNPKPKVCKTDYIVVLARTLYWEREQHVSDVLRVVELANVFFLMEECTLLSQKIPMDKWLKKKQEQLNI